jgi:hypothetical protein
MSKSADSIFNAAKIGLSKLTAEAGSKHGVDPALLSAIAVRETGARNINQPDGMGRGIFQIDLGAHPNVTEAQALDPAWSANYAAKLFASNYNTLNNKYGSQVNGGMVTAASVRAYNAGFNYMDKKIKSGVGALDQGTAHNNYVSTVLGVARHCFGYKG